ncbi:MAG: hypothetical protein KAR14_14485, partial [Candidatus Aminicenantes bacterium]|nr:hypothetical protein [Candidatus Aminicenantes bacterium]
MKKLLPLLLVFVIISAVLTINLNADSTKFFGNFGMMTDDSFNFDFYLWTIGVNLDFSINDLFMISPDVNVITYKFEFSTFLLEPAVLANFKLGTFFAGAGLSKFFIISGSGFGESTDIALKVNGGFRGDNFKFRVYIITPFTDLFTANIIGATIGIGF